VHQDVVALLQLQADDDELMGIEDRLGAYAPVFDQLDKALAAAKAEVERARAELEAGEKQERDLQTKTEEQRALHARSVSQLDAVRKTREAAAAVTQAEITRRFLEELERETHAAVQKVVEMRARLRQREDTLEEQKMLQQDQRESMEREMVVLRSEAGEARGKREASAGKVPRSLLQKYDRLRQRRRNTSVFAVRGASCGNCDMAVPIQRRNELSASGGIEPCEACGVLLYVADS
jgi:predicted  nucleic acid-binding Zn-ribbon protein